MANTAHDGAQSSQRDDCVRIQGIRYNFHDYYLNVYKSRSKPFVPCGWILELSTGSDGLLAELDRDPLRVFDREHVTVELVKQCLATFIARTRRDTRTKSEAREHYMRTKAGVSDVSLTLIRSESH